MVQECETERPDAAVEGWPSTGRAATLKRRASRALNCAARCDRQKLEVKIVTDREKNSVFIRTSDSRQTSPAVTPPTIMQTVSEGNIASRE